MKKFCLLLLLAVGIVVGILAFKPTAQKVNAQVTSAVGGYYSGQFDADSGWAVPMQTRFDYYGYPRPTWNPGGGTGGWEFEFTGPDNYLNTESFINKMRDMLNDASWGFCYPHIPVTYNDYGWYDNPCIQAKMATHWASYIVNTMMGVPASQFRNCGNPADIWDNAGCGISFARGNFNAWADIIRYYSAQGWIEWHSWQFFGVGHLNTINGYNGEDNFYFSADDSESAWSLVFHNPPTAANPSGSAYILKKWCGNVTGEATPLVLPPSGDFVTADCNVVQGWAWDQKNYQNNFRVMVRIYRDAVPAFGGIEVTPPGGIWADQPGPAGQNPYPGGWIPGNHGFSFDISPWADVVPHNYYVLAVATNIFGFPSGPEFWLTNNPRRVPATGSSGCFVPTCSALNVSVSSNSTMPDVVEPGQPFSARVGMADVPGMNFGYTVTMVAPAGGVRAGTMPTGTVTFPGLVDNVPGDAKIARWTVNFPGGSLDCSDDYKIAKKPYMRVYGGDARAGGVFSDNAATCSAANANPALQQNGVIYGVDNFAGPLYSGASTQYAAFAMGTIQNFFTAGSRGGVGSPALPPDDLAFGNEVAAPGTGHYGGNYGQAQCVHDYFADSASAASGGGAASYVIPAGDTPPVLLTPLSGQVRVSGTITGKHVIYVRGNLLIDGNITFGAYGSVAAMPSVYFIVQGNILVRDSVSQIAGVFIAQPRAGVPDSGKIFTCVRPDGSKYTAAQLHNSCGTQLTINGAFIADQVRLLRTFSTLRSAAPNEGSPGSAAEVFKYTPELYLATPDDILRRSGQAQPVDAITSLPPIL